MKSLLVALMMVIGTSFAQANQSLTFQDQVNIINGLLGSAEAQNYDLGGINVNLGDYMSVILRDHLAGDLYDATVKLLCLTSTPEMYTCQIQANFDDGETESMMRIRGEVYFDDSTKQILKIENIQIQVAG